MGSLGHPYKFQRVLRLGSVTARHLVVGVSHSLLPPPRRLCNRRCLFVCLCVSLLATLRKNFERICVKFSEKVGNWPMKKKLYFGGDPDHAWIQGLFSGFVIGRYGKWLTDILIRQMAALVRRALAEVCTMHCPSSFSPYYFFYFFLSLFTSCALYSFF